MFLLLGRVGLVHTINLIYITKIYPEGACWLVGWSTHPHDILVDADNQWHDFGVASFSYGALCWTTLFADLNQEQHHQFGRKSNSTQDVWLNIDTLHMYRGYRAKVRQRTRVSWKLVWSTIMNISLVDLIKVLVHHLHRNKSLSSKSSKEKEKQQEKTLRHGKLFKWLSRIIIHLFSRITRIGDYYFLYRLDSLDFSSINSKSGNNIESSLVEIFL